MVVYPNAKQGELAVGKQNSVLWDYSCVEHAHAYPDNPL
jgi:hypothetical protein